MIVVKIIIINGTSLTLSIWGEKVAHYIWRAPQRSLKIGSRVESALELDGAANCTHGLLLYLRRSYIETIGVALSLVG